MKRRLDLALALVHEPRLLFLDEPTTGLDPQSRTALWEEVGRLAKEDGVTVFLTTQYLEEADVLADRVGIIDRGSIVAEGTPRELKAEIGRPSVEAVPVDPADRDRLRGVLDRFGEACGAAAGAEAVRLDGGPDRLADVVRALDAEDLRVTDLRLHQPTLDDVFLAKTGRSLEGAGAASDDDARARARRRVSTTTLAQLAVLARRSMLQTLRTPFQLFPIIFFPGMLLAVNSSGLASATKIPGFPADNYITFALAVTFMQGSIFALINAGTNIAGDLESGFFGRLALTPLKAPALLGGMLVGISAVGALQSSAYILMGVVGGAPSRRASRASS